MGWEGGKDGAKEGIVLETSSVLLHMLHVGCTYMFMEKVSGTVPIQCIPAVDCISHFLKAA